MKDRLPRYVRGATGIATALAIGIAGGESAEKTGAQTPPVSGEQTNVLFIPYAAFEKTGSGGISFPPSTPTPKEELYPSPKMTSLPNSCNDGTPGRKVQDVLAELSDFADSFFPGIGFKYIAIAKTKDDLAENTKDNPNGKNYALFNLNGYRRMVIKADLSNASENPLGTLQAGQKYVAAKDHVGTSGFPSFEGADVTVFETVGCPLKN